MITAEQIEEYLPSFTQTLKPWRLVLMNAIQSRLNAFQKNLEAHKNDLVVDTPTLKCWLNSHKVIVMVKTAWLGQLTSALFKIDHNMYQMLTEDEGRQILRALTWVSYQDRDSKEGIRYEQLFECIEWLAHRHKIISLQKDLRNAVRDVTLLKMMLDLTTGAAEATKGSDMDIDD